MNVAPEISSLSLMAELVRVASLLEREAKGESYDYGARKALADYPQPLVTLAPLGITEAGKCIVAELLAAFEEQL